MQRPRIRVALWLPLLLSSAFAACGDGDELPVALIPGDSAGAGGEEAGTPNQGGGPASVGGGGGRPSSNVGEAGSEQGGESGAPVTGGGAGSIGGAGGGGMTSEGEQLPLCARLSLKTSRAFQHSRAFAQAVYADCRLSWLVPLGPNLDEYRQQLTIWDLEFWGCQGEPVTTFGLVWGTPELSSGDVAALIEAYLVATDAVDAQLGLSPAEYREMKSALERLGVPYIADRSSEPSNPSCGAGGAGGEGGAGSAGAASGGAP